jgi:hypothetical protein
MGRDPSTGFRGRAAVVVAVMVALGVTAFGWAAADDDGSSVGTGSDGPGEYARYLRLDEGRAGTVAVSASERVQVWWRGPGTKGWSAPQVVDGGSDRYLTGTNVRLAGTTLAIRATYNTKPPWEYADEVDEPGVSTSVFIVCRTGSCVASDHYAKVQEPPCRRGSCLLSRPESKGVIQVPELSSDGGQVFFGATERGYVVWSHHDGLRELEPERLPARGVLGTPMLAPDGTLRVVAGREENRTCGLRLFTSRRVKESTSAVAFTEQAGPAAAATSSGNCATTLEAFASDQLLVHTDRAEPTFLIQVGDRWHATAEDPTGMVRYRPRPGRQASGSTVRTGYWHWREVVTGSPDGRRLVAQVHFPGEARWTEPVTVAVAPPGFKCFEIAPTSTPGQEPFYVSVRCRSRPSPEAEWTYVGVHAVTEDGVTWASAFGDQLPTRVGEDLYFGGAPAHRWTSEGGLGEVGPPVPANSKTLQVDDGTVVLVAAKPHGSRCRLVVRVAEPGETRWSAPLTNPDPFVPPSEPCRPVGQYDGRVVSLYFPSDGGKWLPARVIRSDGKWVVTARRAAG